ncbi:MAG TPA: hypothetical protein PLN38_08320 [Chitinophagales bacterium]|nr:hypothetical protein [Chitinophagales bacterium]
MIDYKILFKYTTRSRPDWFVRGMQSIIENVNSSNYVILVTLDDDDAETIAVSKRYLGNPNVKIVAGQSTDKINAINRDMEQVEDWDILVNFSDDMIFTQLHFDDYIRMCFDDLGECLHFPDGNTTAIITMSVLGREFYDRFGYIYNPEYLSFFCDNEQTEAAKLLGVYKFVDKSIFLHLHPAYAKATSDALYMNCNKDWAHDEEVYNRRKQYNFYLGL